MNLDQRVQAIEQELEILKHQIQATLLDIREQLLNATYPELRAEEPYVSEKSAPETNPSKPIRQVVTTPGKAQAAPAASDDSTGSVVQVRRITLDDVSQDEPPSYKTPPPANRTQQLLLDDLEADYSAPLLPVNRQRPDYDRSDDTLHAPPVRRVTVDPNPMPFSEAEEDAPPIVAQTELLGTADWDTLELLEDWVLRKVKQFGPKHTRELIKAYTDQGHFDLRMKGILLQLTTIIGSEDSAEPQLPPANTPREEEIPQKTILRLIAGLQNAGITSNGRKKPHG